MLFRNIGIVLLCSCGFVTTINQKACAIISYALDNVNIVEEGISMWLYFQLHQDIYSFFDDAKSVLLPEGIALRIPFINTEPELQTAGGL